MSADRYQTIDAHTVRCTTCSTRSTVVAIPVDEQEQHDTWHAEHPSLEWRGSTFGCQYTPGSDPMADECSKPTRVLFRTVSPFATERSGKRALTLATACSEEHALAEALALHEIGHDVL